MNIMKKVLSYQRVLVLECLFHDSPFKDQFFAVVRLKCGFGEGEEGRVGFPRGEQHEVGREGSVQLTDDGGLSPGRQPGDEPGVIHLLALLYNCWIC